MQSFITFKTQWKNETLRILFMKMRMFYLKCNPKFFYTHIKKHFPVKKSTIFWLDFTSVLSSLQKSQVENNFITILGYSNDKNT